MDKTLRLRIALFALFVLAYAAIMAVAHQQVQAYARQEAERRGLDVLLAHRAIHTYVTRTLRPELYRAQDSGQLSRDYFDPKSMSFTYIARSVQTLINDARKELGVPQVYFKLASNSPRNPINLADAAESALLDRMNAGEVKEIRDMVTIDGHRYLYLALPVERTNKTCLRCHGDPADAPAALVKLYGTERGFREQMGDIRALISIRVPFDSFEQQAQRVFGAVALAGLLTLGSIYLLIVYFLGRLDAKQALILQQNARFEHLSVTDPLTGIHNRRGFQQRLEQEMSRAARYGLPLGLILFDIDFFKRVNDRLGHAAGDRLLQELAARVGTAMRAADVFGRWGGEEFIVMAPQTDADEAFRLAEKIRLDCAGTELLADTPCTISLGVTAYRPGERVEDFIARADAALYQSKRDGRNRTTAAPLPVADDTVATFA